MSTNPLPENQKQRWFKYGANVALSSLLVIAIAIMAIAFADSKARRIDTTANSDYSLKPQTIAIIQDLKTPIRLVSLYTRSSVGPKSDNDYAQRVDDLLDEYKRRGRNIDVESIDPIANPAKVDDLVGDVMKRYGGEVKRYKAFVDNAGKDFEPITTFAKAEGALLSPLPIDRMSNNAGGANDFLASITDTMADLPTRLDQKLKLIDQLSGRKVPDYKSAADMINGELARVSDIASDVIAGCAKFKDDPKATDAEKQYMIDAIRRYQILQGQVDAATAEYKKLGDLKLDDLRQKLGEKDAILVMGENDMRSLSVDQVWKVDTDRRVYQNSSDDQVKPEFLGEQQITGAILSLTMAKKPKIVFIRPGGAPLTLPGFPPIQQEGPFSRIAERLREYNFDVLEKDASGKFAAEAQMQGMQAPPDATDEDMKDAIWVILGFPPSQDQQMSPPPSLAPKLAEHLKAGGSAMCLFEPKADDLAGALKDYGLEAKTDAVIVHEPIKGGGQSTDYVEEAKKLQPIFVLNEYGDQTITKPLVSLDSLMLSVVPIQTAAAKDCTVEPIIPAPLEPKAWSTHEIDALQNGQEVKFNPLGGDQSEKLYFGGVSEKKDGGRVVAIGSSEFMINYILAIPDAELAKRNIRAARFPANAELFCNCIFWLAHLEPMIAISPSAMEVSRIGPMSDWALRMWHVGVLIGGLPLLVVICGIAVYFARRD